MTAEQTTAAREVERDSGPKRGLGYLGSLVRSEEVAAQRPCSPPGPHPNKRSVKYDAEAYDFVDAHVFKKNGKDYHVSSDLTAQANHLGVTIEADIIKQKQPELNGGYEMLNMGDSSYGKFDKRIYTDLCSDHPIDLTRYQVLNCYCGRAGLINSGGGSGEDDFGQAVRTAVINKRAGGMGLISGRKAFQRPMDEGVKLLNTIQDVYLDGSITVA